MGTAPQESVTMDTNLVSFSHAKGQLTYHLEWAPKYRYNMFRQEKYIKLCEEILREVADRHGIAIRELSVMPDHVHTIVDIPPAMSVSKALNLLKGASAYELFRRQPKFRLRYTQGHFWSAGKFYRSIGDTDLKTTAEYVRNQRQMHPHQTTLMRFGS